MVKINGEMFDVSGKTVGEYLALENFDRNRIVVELNKEIVPKIKYDEIILCDDDVVEIVSFVGGG